MANVRKWLVLIGALGVLVAGLHVASTSVQAQSPSPPVYSGVDMLFVVDQSGSTCGIPCGAPDYWGNGTDPDGLRFQAPQYSLQWLYQFQDLVKNYDPLEVNMGLFGFGDSQRLLLDWTNLSYLQDADAQRLGTDISDQRFGNVNLGNTDMYEALREAKQMFDQAPAPSATGTQHLKAIVLLTDGEPCASNTCNDQTKTAHLARIEELMRTNFPDYKLYVVISDANNQFFTKWQTAWETIVCANQAAGCNPMEQYVQVMNGAEISSEFNRILTDLISQISSAVRRQTIPLNNGVGVFDVPPYQQFLRINIFKTDNTPITNEIVRRPDGTQSPVKTQGVGTAIQTYEILLPEPGQWQLDLSQVQPSNLIQNVEAVTDLISAVGAAEVIPATPGQPELFMYTPITFTARIVDGTGVPLAVYGDPLNPNYKLDVVLKLYRTDGITTPQGPPDYEIPLALDTANAPGINQFTATEFLRFSGDFEVRLDASYLDNAGQVVYVLRDATMKNVVIDAQGTQRDMITIQESYVDINGLNPASQRAGQPVGLRAEIRTKVSGQPLPAAADMAFQVTATDQAGTVVLQDTVYPNSPTANVGEVLSDLVIDQPGQYVVDVAVGWPATDGTFDAVGSTLLPLEVRPIIDLRVLVLRPENGSSEEVWPFEFLGKTPLVIQVEIRDESNNAVSLSDLTSGTETRPTVILKHGDESEDLTTQMVEVSKGIYQTTLEHRGRGDYKVEASVQSPAMALVGDYDWNPSRAVVEHNREWSIVTIVGGIVILGLIIGLLAIVIGAVVIYQRRRQNPLQGTLVLKTRDTQGHEDIVTTISLAAFGVNKKTFRNIGEFEKIVVSTHNDPKVSEEKAFYLDDIRIRGADENQIPRSSLPIMEGEDRIMHRVQRPGYLVEYIIGNNTEARF
ncbi:MAG: VWA domain-containing protein [Anaerolineae bacterium]|nr:VWA domain-containing protein [Anaerolineae bacterium]